MDAIAERRLDLKLDDKLIEVWVRIFRPIEDPEFNSWVCPYELQVGELTNRRNAHGADSMQALQLALSILDAQLAHAAKRAGGVLYHYDEPFISILEGRSPRGISPCRLTIVGTAAH